MLAEQAVRAPNINPQPLVRPPTPERLTESLKSAKEMDIPVGPPSAKLHVWISPPDVARVKMTIRVTNKGTDLDYERGPATQPNPLTAVPNSTIFLLHGIQDNSQLGPYLLYKELFTAAGYQVVQVDLRGHGKSTGEWITYGAVESRDMKQVLDVLHDQGVINGPVGVFGISYGAAVGLQWASQDSRVDAVVAVEPFATFRQAAHDAAPMVLGPARFFFGPKQIDDAVDEAGKLAGFDPQQSGPLFSIDKLHVPALIIHSQEDELVSYQNSVMLHEANPRYIKLLTLRNESHFWVWLSSLDMIHHASMVWFHQAMSAIPVAQADSESRNLPIEIGD